MFMCLYLTKWKTNANILKFVKVFYFWITKQQVLFVTELLPGCSKYLKNLDRFTLVTSILKGLLAEFQRLLQRRQTG